MLLGIYPKELKTCPYKNLNLKVDSNFIYECLKLDETKMSLDSG
jgi:hypothetical protein